MLVTLRNSRVDNKEASSSTMFQLRYPRHKHALRVFQAFW